MTEALLVVAIVANCVAIFFNVLTIVRIVRCRK